MMMRGARCGFRTTPIEISSPAHRRPTDRRAHRHALVTRRFRVAHVLHDHVDTRLLLVLRVLHPPLLRLRLALCSQTHTPGGDSLRSAQSASRTVRAPRREERIHTAIQRISPGGAQTEESPHMQCQADRALQLGRRYGRPICRRSVVAPRHNRYVRFRSSVPWVSPGNRTSVPWG